MTILQSFLHFLVATSTWTADLAWGLPMIILTVVIHVLGLGLIFDEIVDAYDRLRRQRHQTAVFAAILGATTLLATVLHVIEAALWAIVYQFLNAIPENKAAMLYSLNAITSYGHTNVTLEERWHLMGAMEALNGWLLFGLTTAFLFAVINKFRTAESKRGNREP